MRPANLGRGAGLGLSVALMLAGCNGAIDGLGASPGTTRSVLAADRTHHGGSWMAEGITSQDLLYVSNEDGVVNVYRYWQHTLTGVLTDFTQPMGECVDAAGDVFVTDYYAKTLVEYAHGGKKPIKTIDDSPNRPMGCAVDRLSGNLAVANFNQGYGEGNLSVYLHGKGKPTVYAGDFTACVYDDRGDLFATAEYGYYDYYTEFFYLPKRSTKLLSIDLPGSSSSGWEYVQSLGWDGKYWVVVSYNRLFRYLIDIKAQHVDTIELTGGYGSVDQIWFYRKTAKAQATQVVGAAPFGAKNDVGYWKYPAGGDPYYEITKDLDEPFGVAISLGT